jgi:ComF family protein
MKIAGFAASAYQTALDWLYPSRCALCGLICTDDPVCTTCYGEFQRLEAPIELFARHEDLSFRASIYKYSGRAAQAVRRLKYQRSTVLSSFLAEEIARGYEEFGFESFQAILPVPIHWLRRCHRGFNQAEFLCRSLPADLVHLDWLDRVKATRPQVGLTMEQRLKNLEGAFRASPLVAGLEILLVDDVATSGGTAMECARALRSSGAKRVGVLTFAGG